MSKEVEGEDVTASTLTEQSQIEEEDKTNSITQEEPEEASDDSFGEFEESEVLMCDEQRRPLEPLSISAHWERDLKSYAREFIELKEARTDLVVDLIDLKKLQPPTDSPTTTLYRQYLKASKEAEEHKAFKYRSGFLDPSDFICQVKSSPDSAYNCPRLAFLKPPETKATKVETPDVAEYVTQQCQQFVNQVWPNLKFRTIYRRTTRIMSRIDRLQQEAIATFSHLERPDVRNEADDFLHTITEASEVQKDLSPSRKLDFSKAVYEALGEDLPDLCFMLRTQIVWPSSMVPESSR
mmetsp:Transcript_4531/g.8701  ORF Transcript_4531/g.8701 Transcript_4531/m.8701 type:complete len:295 (-) Transcript_4531:138-1022(-)